MDGMIARVKRLSCTTITVACLLISLLLGVLDYVTGDVSLFLFYLIPIAIASWYTGVKARWFIVMLCSVELFITNVLVAPSDISIISVRTWNSLMEMCFFPLSAYLIAKVRAESDLLKHKTTELEAVNLDLAAFDYTVAHDLRQPLNLLSIYCQAIDNLFGDQIPEECKTYVRDAYSTILRMNGLIEALLNFSRMGQLELRREAVDLSMLAHEVALSRRLAEPERQVDFRIADGVAANGEVSLLRVVLDNLIGNAWKYTGMREKAVIEFGVRSVDGVLVYFVRDNGSGFDGNDASKLFTPFQRLPGAEKFRGFGIGLATVDRIIRRHGGKVWAEGEPDKGACIYFTL